MSSFIAVPRDVNTRGMTRVFPIVVNGINDSALPH